MDKKITTFIFDCFGVLCTPIVSTWYRKNMVEKGLLDDKINEVLEKFDLNEMSEMDVAEYFSKYQGVTLTPQQIQDEIDNYLDLNRGLVTVIQKLKAQGYKTALLTDANASFFTRKIYPLYPEFKNLFDEIIISSDVGMTKADPKMFFYALDKVNSKPEETLFIDDNKANIDRANALGIGGFLYTDNDSFSNDIKKSGIEI